MGEAIKRSGPRDEVGELAGDPDSLQSMGSFLETNRAPENGWLEYKRCLLGPGLCSGANLLIVSGSVVCICVLFSSEDSRGWILCGF